MTTIPESIYRNMLDDLSGLLANKIAETANRLAAHIDDPNFREQNVRDAHWLSLATEKLHIYTLSVPDPSDNPGG